MSDIWMRYSVTPDHNAHVHTCLAITTVIGTAVHLGCVGTLFFFHCRGVDPINIHVLNFILASDLLSSLLLSFVLQGAKKK